jgi:putative endonuclease
MNKRQFGDIGEKIASNFLCINGYKIIEKNYRCRDGEIDIVARQRDTIVFIEVKTRKNLLYGTPEEAITPSKMMKLKAVAEQYEQTHENLPPDWRIDVVAIEINGAGKISRIELIENAIEDTI